MKTISHPTETARRNEQNNPLVIGVLGAKGGAGATTIAVNLSSAFGQAGSTTLLDANLQQPDAALILAREPRFSLLDLLTRAPEIEQQVFEACCCEFPGQPHSRLISPPLDGHAGAAANLSMVANCLPQIQHYSNRWIVDLPRNLDRHLVNMLDKCTILTLVMEANLISLAAARRWFSIFSDLGYCDEAIVVILNRVGKKLKYMEEQVLTALAGRTVVKIPDASALTEECAIAGKPVVIKYPRDGFSKAVRELVQSIESNTPSSGQQSLQEKIKNRVLDSVSTDGKYGKHRSQYQIQNQIQHHGTEIGTKLRRTGFINNRVVI